MLPFLEHPYFHQLKELRATVPTDFNSPASRNILLAPRAILAFQSKLVAYRASAS
jgi:hypothetical protein